LIRIVPTPLLLQLQQRQQPCPPRVTSHTTSGQALPTASCPVVTQLPTLQAASHRLLPSFLPCHSTSGQASDSFLPSRHTASPAKLPTLQATSHASGQVFQLWPSQSPQHPALGKALNCNPIHRATPAPLPRVALLPAYSLLPDFRRWPLQYYYSHYYYYSVNIPPWARR